MNNSHYLWIAWEFSLRLLFSKKGNFRFELCVYQFPMEEKGKKQNAQKCGTYQNPTKWSIHSYQILLEMVNLHVIMS